MLHLQLFFGITLLFAVLLGCGEDSVQREFDVPPLKVLAAELRNPEFRWHGPCSREDRIPVSHAARALAYIGDDAVPVLFQAAQDPRVQMLCIYDALDEIGLPVDLYRDEIMVRDMTGIKDWWASRGAATMEVRSFHREMIGLPAVSRQQTSGSRDQITTD